MLKPQFLSAILVLLAVAASRAAAADLVSTVATPGGFPLVERGRAAQVVVEKGDFRVVQIAAELFAGDVERVSKVKPVLRGAEDAAAAGPVVYAGTLGKSPALDKILREKNIDTSGLKDKWESFLIATVDQPAAGVEKGLLIVGSDRRGTAYGLMTLSEQMGVSPWVWWADVPPAGREQLFVRAGTHLQGPPSVKFRGIFLNDEDWGLQPWAAKTVEPTSAGGVGDIGPKTYAKIFELLLRHRANFCWPAMHNTTNAFNIYADNKKVADDYGIVMGSSHCEPMLRNNVTEWGEARAASYNYVTNRQGVLDYWKQRVVENGKFENVYTLGMRGIHDSDMAGGGTREQRVQRLNQIMADQRDLIKELITPDVAKVPQIFCPYKEVLTLYQAGAVPPEDVTLVWADDNHGYLRQLATPEEQRRSGGFGVYYHISYWGRPHDYLWLCTTPPSLIWQELSKAYDYQSRNLWVINVGDIKPAEIGISLSMAMAYDINRYTADNIGNFPKDFATQQFGAANAEEIAGILKSYYRLNYQRKPEHLGFNTSQNPRALVAPTEFTDEEIRERLSAFARMARNTEELYAKIPAEQKDAFYQLVLFPVRASNLLNQKALQFDLHRRAAARGDAPIAGDSYQKAKEAYDNIQKEVAYYNDTLAGGKWKFMMSSNPHDQDVFRLSQPVAVAANPPAPPELTKTGGSTFGFALTPPGNMPTIGQNGFLSLAAERFTRKVDRGPAAWKVIPDLGRMGDSVAVYPTTTASIPDVKQLAALAPALEYDFFATAQMPTVTINVQAIPTHRINPQRGLRYAIAIDDETPQVIDLETPENSPEWSANVLRGAAFGKTTHALKGGKNTLRIYMVDPGVVIDHLIIDAGGLPKSYLPPGRGAPNE